MIGLTHLRSPERKPYMNESLNLINSMHHKITDRAAPGEKTIGQQGPQVKS